MGALSLQISLILLLQVTAAVVSIPSAAPPLPGRKGLIIGAWVPIKDIKDPYISEIAGFAVNEYNKESSAKLKFEKVLSGESQVVAGTNYRLIIAATDGTTTRNYEAVVWEQHKLWVNIRQLTSFKPVTH